MNDLRIHDSVSFVGGQFGDAKHNCLLNSDAFILPSFSEGLPMSVLEAWSYRLPVIITKHCNLDIGYRHNAAIAIDPDPQSISEGIEQLFAMPAIERLKMGHNGFKLVSGNFSWSSVATSMTQVYDWILGRNERPPFVFN
jgi:poly(glycerol-phosphate) alpha-glucosyltransferase